jgi:hypothetical protein
METHQPDPLPDGVVEELRAIIDPLDEKIMASIIAGFSALI